MWLLFVGFLLHLLFGCPLSHQIGWVACHSVSMVTDSCPTNSLTLVDSSLPVEAEPELRCYISRRLSKGALLGGMGNIAAVELR
jgi:hypothetical protein